MSDDWIMESREFLRQARLEGRTCKNCSLFDISGRCLEEGVKCHDFYPPHGAEDACGYFKEKV